MTRVKVTLLLELRMKKRRRRKKRKKMNNLLFISESINLINSSLALSPKL